MKVSIHQNYWNSPDTRWQLWMDHTQGPHPEVLSGKEQIELLKIQNYSKIPGFLGDNKNWRQTKIRNIVYLNDCNLRNQITYLLLDAKDHHRILRSHGNFPYDTRKMAFKPKIGNHIAQQKEQRQRMWLLATCRQKREMRPPTGGSPHTRNTPKISHLRLDAEAADQTEVARPQAAPLPRTGRRKPRPRARKDWTRPREEKEVADRKRCLREALQKRGFAILPATSLALLCIEISESIPSRNFPKKRNSPSRGIRTAAEIFIRSIRPRE